MARPQFIFVNASSSTQRTRESFNEDSIYHFNNYSNMVSLLYSNSIFHEHKYEESHLLGEMEKDSWMSVTFNYILYLLGLREDPWYEMIMPDNKQPIEGLFRGEMVLEEENTTEQGIMYFDKRNNISNWSIWSTHRDHAPIFSDDFMYYKHYSRHYITFAIKRDSSAESIKKFIDDHWDTIRYPKSLEAFNQDHRNEYLEDQKFCNNVRDFTIRQMGVIYSETDYVSSSILYMRFMELLGILSSKKSIDYKRNKLSVLLKYSSDRDVSESSINSMTNILSQAHTPAESHFSNVHRAKEAKLVNGYIKNLEKSIQSFFD